MAYWLIREQRVAGGRCSLMQNAADLRPTSSLSTGTSTKPDYQPH